MPDLEWILPKDLCAVAIGVSPLVVSAGEGRLERDSPMVTQDHTGSCGGMPALLALCLTASLCLSKKGFH